MAAIDITNDERRPLWTRYSFSLLFYAVVTVSALAFLNLPGAQDYVGTDNDDVMRLVVVRDLLAGQGWFDNVQHRLGLEAGTAMHWSRLIDLPIAGLIVFFRQLMPESVAEAGALLAWPLSLTIPFLAMMGLAGRRMGGPQVMQIAFAMTTILVVTSNRFLPGAIDHHNVQFVLIATMAAMLVDADYKPWSFAVAGAAAAAAIAIGAETTPIVAVVCLIVAVLWAWHGSAFAAAARAFALAIAIGITVVFFATVPPSRYGEVTCDSLSIGYYGITAAGGALLFLSALLASGVRREFRFAVLAGDGVIVVATALILAPQCLRNPLADLDPLLVRLWLSNVIEAQSVLSELSSEPGTFGGFYAVGLFALLVCLSRIWMRDRVELHAILLALVAAAWGIALIQVRGAVFANLLAILPLALLISELRRHAHADPENMSIGFFFLGSALMAVPSVWAFVGVLAAEGTDGIANRLRSGEPKQTETAASADCESRTAIAPMVNLPATTVAAPSDSGSEILRFTAHRVLSAPYHRNQGGMLTELHIGLATPAEAVAFLRGANVGLIAYCPEDAQTKRLAAMKPDGLYAALGRGEIPPYLVALPQAEGSGFRLYKVDLPAE
ncbi:hypothetical protein [Ciceribacter thiooxidans]|uniref:Oligosaccharyl transferase-like protein n=1 Tax=Ciceribacter thiooxidans TaxID=1969821 RepID=A0ABV7I339_9HYPH|nr:hypothetical protein [Ciceribacter thiooxidans]